MFCFVIMPGAQAYVVSAGAAINPTAKFGRRSAVRRRRRHERAADARRLADRLNDGAGLVGALRPGGKTARRWHQRAA
jgi:hypothetical protein